MKSKKAVGGGLNCSGMLTLPAVMLRMVTLEALKSAPRLCTKRVDSKEVKSPSAVKLANTTGARR